MISDEISVELLHIASEAKIGQSQSPVEQFLFSSCKDWSDAGGGEYKFDQRVPSY